MRTSTEVDGLAAPRRGWSHMRQSVAPRVRWVAPFFFGIPESVAGRHHQFNKVARPVLFPIHHRPCNLVLVHST
jgi:hypothetical protein